METLVRVARLLIFMPTSAKFRMKYAFIAIKVIAI